MEHLRSCHCCGLIQRVPAGWAALCARCETSLDSWCARLGGNHVSSALALAALALYVPAICLPFLRIEQLGHAHESNIVGGVATLFAEGHRLVAAVVLLFSIVLPVVKLTALLALSQSHWRLPERHRAVTYRLVEHLGRWGMLDVLLVAVMVAFVKLGGLVEFSPGIGLVTFTLFVLLSLCASATFDPFWLWDAGHPLLRSTAGDSSSSSGASSAAEEPTALPQAREAPPRRLRWVWILPLLALGLAGWLMWQVRAQQGPAIAITFFDGRGIGVGDPLRYRGIDCGVVERVELLGDLMAVRLVVRLTPAAEPLAREGARFWIVRPQVDLTGVGGLETIVGPNYLTLLPGESRGALATDFRGLEQPPLLDLEFPGGMEVVLQSSQGTGLRSGLGVYYRDVRVGGVIDSRLAGDGSAIETRVYIRPQYRHLIRSGAQFWNAGGLHLRGSLTGFSIHIGTAETFLRGGIGLALPPMPGEPVENGHRFTLHPRPESEWLEWQPAVTPATMAASLSWPQLQPALLRWTHDGFFRNSPQQRSGWVLVDQQGVTGPRDLLTVPEGALDGQATLQIGEQRIDLSRATVPAGDDPVAGIALPEGWNGPALSGAEMPAARRPSAPEDLFVVGGPEEEPVYVAAVRLSPEGNQWNIDSSLALPASRHGAVAMAVKDGALLGRVIHGVDGALIWLGTGGDAVGGK